MHYLKHLYFTGHSDIELQAIATRYFEPTKALQELPLILIPQHLAELSIEELYQQPSVQQAIQQWLDLAHWDDQRLMIERLLIPYTPILISNTPKGRQFFKLAKAIADIPVRASIVPKNQNQAYWWKTLHYCWQAAGVMFAEKLLGIMPHLLGKQGILDQHLPVNSLQNLDLLTDIDLACFRLLVRGQRIIHQQAVRQAIVYPFRHPFELLLEIQQQDFQIAWGFGPTNPDSEWLTKQEQRQAINTRIRLLQNTWQDSAPETLDELVHIKNYISYLRQVGWSGNWILALQSQQSGQFNPHIEPYMEAYIEALRHGKALFVDEFEWRTGQPYQKRTTNNPLPLQGGISLQGYLTWYWN